MLCIHEGGSVHYSLMIYQYRLSHLVRDYHGSTDHCVHSVFTMGVPLVVCHLLWEHGRL